VQDISRKSCGKIPKKLIKQKALNLHMAEVVTIEREKYEGMRKDMERMEETIEVLSSTDTVKKVQEALRRMSRGEFLSEEQVRT
jgi:low affinity Fe/Cu permease